MHAVKVAHVGKIGQVSANGLQRDVKSLCQIVDHHATFGADDVENFILAKTEGHVPFLATAILLRSVPESILRAQAGKFDLSKRCVYAVVLREMVRLPSGLYACRRRS
jgi:hypothetical protein